MIYCLNPDCPNPHNPDGNVHCQYCGVPIALRNRFKALRPIGQGGFGKTYLAEDLDNRSKPCVVKRLTYRGSSEQATAKAQQLFEQEAERLDQLTHPKIPRLLAYFEECDYLYLVQEFIEGHNLQDELAQQGPFDEEKIRQVLHGLLPILQFVHSRSVIHRDIKPDNIMRRQSGGTSVQPSGHQSGHQSGQSFGELVLIDFGVAKFLAESGIAPKGMAMATTIGTPGYAAPEQMRGRVTPASDLFALGATCFQLLTQGFEAGQSLVGHRWVQDWRQAVKQPLSNELAAILSRLIALEESQRYPTATAVLRDLNALAGSSAQPTGSGGGPISSLPTVVAAKAPSQSSSQSPQGPFPGPVTPIQTPVQTSPPVQTPPVQAAAQIPPTQTPPAPAFAQTSPVNAMPVHPSQPQPLAEPSPLPLVAAAPVKPPRVGNGFWLKFSVWSYVGQSLGFFLGMVVAAFLAVAMGMDADTDMPKVLSLMTMMYWLVGGFVVGIVQWLALRKGLPKAIAWVPATVMMFWAIAVVRFTIGGPSLIVGTLLGAMMSLPQWWVLHRHSARAYGWIPWTGLMIALLFRVLAANDYLGMFTWGLASPVLNGLFLMWILRKSRGGTA